MTRSITMTALAMAFGMLLFSADVGAENKTATYLGKRENCLHVSRIIESWIVDNQTILFKVAGGAIYISRLPVQCPSLKISGGFAYKTGIHKLCTLTIIKVVGPPGTGLSCGMGEFVRFSQGDKLGDVEKLLKNGLLDALVEEGAFKEAFQVEKPEPETQEQ